MIRLVANGLLCAALFSLAMRPWGHGLFALVAASLLGASLMRERSLWRGGLLAGIAWLGLGIPALEGVSARLWWGFPALLVVLASGWVLAGVVVIHVSRRAGERAGWMAFVLAFTAAEFALSRRWVVGDAAVGFLAYSQADTPLRLLAGWSGTSLLALTALLVGAAGYHLTRRRWRSTVLLLAPVVTAALVPVPGTATPEVASSVPIAIIQAAQPDVDRLLAGYDEAIGIALMEVYQQLVERAVEQGGELLALGETVLPRGTNLWEPARHVRDVLARAPVTIVGAHERSPDGLFNSAFAWNGTSLEPVYRKRSLVPIIESAYTPGTSSTPVMLQGALVGLGICLDTVHAGLVRESVLQGAELLVFITDDTFAGFTSTPHVHLRTAALRAAETGRAVVFANESGPSAMFDPRGNVVAYLPHGEPGVVVAELPLAFGTTPFVALGDWLGWLCVVATAVLAGVAALRPRRLERDITSS